MFGSVSRTVRLVLLLTPFAMSAFLILGSLMRAVLSGDFSGGGDFRVFYEGAVLFAQGRFAELYTPEQFIQLAGIVDINLWYVYSPVYARAWVPFSWLGMDSAWIVWTAGSVALIAATAAAASKRILPAAILAVTCAPAAMSLQLGQNAAVSAAIIAGSYLLARRGHLMAAGAELAILVFKPQIAVGLGVWWLADRRYRKAAWWALATATGIVAASWLIDGPAWSPYWTAVAELATIRGPTLQVSLMGFVDLLRPGWPVARVIGAGAGMALVAVFALWARSPRDPSIAFVVATAVTLLASPYVAMYDYLILLAPIAMLIDSHDVERLWLPATALSWTVLFSTAIAKAMKASFGFAIQLAPVALGAMLVALVLTLDRPGVASPSVDDAVGSP